LINNLLIPTFALCSNAPYRLRYISATAQTMPSSVWRGAELGIKTDGAESRKFDRRTRCSARAKRCTLYRKRDDYEDTWWSRQTISKSDCRLASWVSRSRSFKVVDEITFSRSCRVYGASTDSNCVDVQLNVRSSSSSGSISAFHWRIGGRASGGRLVVGRKSASKASKAFGSGKADEKHHVGFDEVDGRFSSPPGVGELSATRRNFDSDFKTTSFD
jgi:hypothetical protein